MALSDWISKAHAAGWQVTSIEGDALRLSCACHGCKSTLCVSFCDIGPGPTPCSEEHHGTYGMPAFDLYKPLIEALCSKRRALGLSQEDLNAATGLADGHISKLESFARIPQFPTFQLWAQTLGLEITLAPSAPPTATAFADYRPKSYSPNADEGHHKHDN